MENLMSPMDMLQDATTVDVPQLTISPADTSLDNRESSTPDVQVVQQTETEEKKPVKKRKSWGQELPTPKTNLPPRKRAKTEDEKEQRRIERVLRNRAAAQTSRERKRLEVEKLEGEKQRMEQQNQFLLQRLAQMEAENNRLNRQVAQLSAEIRGSRGTTPKSIADTTSPTLTPTLFKQEGEDFAMDKIPFPTPSVSDYSPSIKLEDLAESSDSTQHPAAVLCDLPCQSKDSKDLQHSEPEWLATSSRPSPHPALQMAVLQLLFLTMTSAAYSTVILPLSQILNSMKAGSPLTFSTEEMYRHLPLIHWLISTRNLSSSSTTSSTRRQPRLRMRVLTRLLACSPALARPLRDATGKALQLAVEAATLRETRLSTVDGVVGASASWESLLTMAWAIDSIRLSNRRSYSGTGQQKRLSMKPQRKSMKRNHEITTSMRSLRRFGIDKLGPVLGKHPGSL